MGYNNQDLRSRVATEVPHLRRFARALTGTPAKADELVQECVEKALSRLHLYDETKNIRIWLYTILRNIYINKQDVRHLSHIKTQDTPRQETALLPGPAEQNTRDIANALSRLTEDQREVLALIAIEGVGYEEVANIINVPIGTVIARLSRARNHMKTIMNVSSDTITGQN